MDSSPARPVLFLLLLVCAAAVYLAGNVTTPLWDRDEPRYAQCSRQMLESGDWVVPRLYDEPRAAKPPLIYWCQASAMKLIGATPLARRMSEPQVFAARLPSSLAMLATIAILYASLRRTIGEQRTLWTLFVFSTALLTIFCAKICLTDSVQLVFITTAQLALYRLWRGSRDWLTVILFGLALGLGGLTKGPFILGVVAMTAVVLVACRYFFGAANSTTDNRPPLAKPEAPTGTMLRAIAVLLIVLAIVLPWLYLVHLRAPGFIDHSKAELAKHLGKGGEGHSFSPGYHLTLIWVTFLPWSLLLPTALTLGYMHRGDPVRSFALAAVIGPWLMLELMGTKLPHYAIAFFPALSFLTADAIFAALHPLDLREYLCADLRSSGFIKAAAVWGAAICLVAVGSVELLFWMRRHHVPHLPWGLGWMFAIAAVLYGASVFTCFWARFPKHGVLVMGIGSGLIALLLFGVYLPHAQFLRISQRVAATLRENGVTGQGQVYMVDYKEPSLAFYQDGSIRESPEKSSLVTKGRVVLWTPWLVITDQVWKNSSPDVRQRLTQVGPRERGLAVSDGMRILDVFVVKTDCSHFEQPATGKAVGPDETGTHDARR